MVNTWFRTEDWAAVWIGLLVCALALLAVAGIDVLVTWSLILGVVLLVVLAWISSTFFAAP